MLLTNILIFLVVALIATLIITLSYLNKVQRDAPILLGNVQKLLDRIPITDIRSLRLIVMLLKKVVPIQSMPPYIIDKTMVGKEVYDIIRGAGTITSVTKGKYCVGVIFANDPDSVIMFNRQGKLFDSDRVRLVINPTIIFQLKHIEKFFV